MTNPLARKEDFLVAGRAVAVVAAALAIASNWVWAPALFVSAEKAYTDGLWGLAWFTVPNMLTLVIFGLFAAQLRHRVPRGFTLPAYMEQRHGKPVHRLYLTQVGLLAVLAFAVQLLAGAAFFEAVAGVNFTVVTIALAIFTVTYSALGGLTASIRMNVLSMLSIIGIGGALVAWTVAASGGVETVTAGIRLGGVSGNSMLAVALGFGIPVTIALLSGPWGDNSFWQRMWAVEEDSDDGSGRNVRRAFIAAGFIFVLVPVILGTLGLVAAGSGIAVDNVGRVNIETVLAFLPDWTVLPFGLIIIGGLISTLDSQAMSVGSLFGHDGAPTVERSVPRARAGMVLLAIVGVIIANVPGITIASTFIIYGTVRASTFWPSILTLKRDYIDPRFMAWGIGLAMLVGFPLTFYGNLSGAWPAVLAASLTVWGVSGGLTWLGVRSAERAKATLDAA